MSEQKTDYITPEPEPMTAAFNLIFEAQAEPHLQAVNLWHSPAVSKVWHCVIGYGPAHGVGATPEKAITEAYRLWKESINE